MFATSVSVFLLYIATSEIFVVAILCLFNAISTPSWNYTIVELYPTHFHTTAVGLHLLMARIRAITGTNISGLFVKVNPSIPILDKFSALTILYLFLELEERSECTLLSRSTENHVRPGHLPAPLLGDSMR